MNYNFFCYTIEFLNLVFNLIKNKLKKFHTSGVRQKKLSYMIFKKIVSIRDSGPIFRSVYDCSVADYDSQIDTCDDWRIKTYHLDPTVSQISCRHWWIALFEITVIFQEIFESTERISKNQDKKTSSVWFQKTHTYFSRIHGGIWLNESYNSIDKLYRDLCLLQRVRNGNANVFMNYVSSNAKLAQIQVLNLKVKG